jgi:hypothetical protein
LDPAAEPGRLARLAEGRNLFVLSEMGHARGTTPSQDDLGESEQGPHATGISASDEVEEGASIRQLRAQLPGDETHINVEFEGEDIEPSTVAIQRAVPAGFEPVSPP